MMTGRDRGRRLGRGRGQGRGDLSNGVDVDVNKIRGEFNFPRNGVNKKWVRAKETSPERLGIIFSDSFSSQAREGIATSANTNAPENHGLERRGTHKLVTKTDRGGVAPMSIIEKNSCDYAYELGSTSYSSFATTKSWKRLSQRLHQNREQDIDIDANHVNMKVDQVAVGSNASKSDELASGPRRIVLTKATFPDGMGFRDCVQSGGSELGKQCNASKVTHTSSDHQSRKLLSDFRYRVSGRGMRGARGKGEGRNGRGVRGGSKELSSFHDESGVSCGKNNGLVRVKSHDLSSTPICPMFSRGFLCNNIKCTLRHDVPTEAYRPICVFFQRNGMCSKGDKCPFKHIKVRWDAQICPSFFRVGYCEDPDCTFQHTVSKKSRSNETL